jgi:hypothetical protein
VPGPPAPSPDRPRLTWAPPPLTDPETIALPPGDTSTKLETDRDYIIDLPRTGKGDTFLIGGRNIVLIGGHVSTGDSRPQGGVPEHRAIYIADARGTVHIEGVLIDDVDVGKGDGIDIAAPEATVQIQNSRIVGLTGEERGNHADVVQVWGGVKELRIDRLTGSTNYQGLHIQPDLGTNGPEIIKNVNLFSISETAGNWLTWLAKGSNTCETPTHVTLDEVYIAPRPGRTLGDSVWPPDRNATRDDRASAVQNCLSVLSDDQTEISFPELPSVTGVVRKGPPSGGDFVPEGVAGPDYVSPGYLGG